MNICATLKTDENTSVLIVAFFGPRVRPPRDAIPVAAALPPASTAFERPRVQHLRVQLPALEGLGQS